MRLARLNGTVKNYAWGGYSFIPGLLQVTNDKNEPFAEYWMGVHPQADCKIAMKHGGDKLLRDRIHDAPVASLGEYVYRKFGNMPYLLKALDVKDMLSIQVHPSKAEAEKNFAKENAAGIPLDAPQRNYKDDNHKPELMVAMGDFWLLHGFKPEKELVYTLLNVVELRELLPIFNQSGYAGLYKHVMEMPQQEVNRILQPLVDHVVSIYKEKKVDKDDEDFWAARAALTFNGQLSSANGQPSSIDRGIFSVYLFNLVKLKRGEAIFQDAGVPHAYLEGQNIEIMASSDNVLRGGLTPKHIDVNELLKHVKCEATHPAILKGEKNGDEIIYKTPAPDFELSCFDINAGNTVSFIPSTAEILLLAEGHVTATNGQETVELKTGTPSAIAFPEETVSITANEKSLVFRASVPH
ncbi:MAG: mannose-6-phosphate isomerase, class I [Chitinophagaceae bacterium]